MTRSKKFKIILITGVLAAIVAMPAFSDHRLQGAWLWDGPSHAALLINGNSFVWIVDSLEYVGTFTVSGNVAIFTVTHLSDANTGLWYIHHETWRYNFSFQANNRLLINNWIYLRS